jgi:hypothetical protein
MANHLSNEPGHKLQAVLNNESPDPAEHVTGDYLRACYDWFEGLSAHHWLMATAVSQTYRQGDRAGAERAADTLPPAPRPN